MAALTTTTGKGALKTRATIAAPKPANLWSMTMELFVVTLCTATSALNNAIGISRFIRLISGCDNNLSGTLWPANFKAKAIMLVPMTPIHRVLFIS
jgi:hypothetical protein